ncbi:isochorismate synthase/isochorismate-pyruvate lyase mbtI [Fusarium proliferatum]|nr:isochorismate synthase/isochorismate-pyruvate lyase mbtI [Fusarium proliferatum]
MNDTIVTETIPLSQDVDKGVELVINILASYKDHEYYVYEQNHCWYIGLDCQSSLIIDSAGTSASILNEGHNQKVPVTSNLDQIARDFVKKTIKQGFKIFGYVGYSYAAHARGIAYTPGEWPLLSLMVPRYQVVIAPDKIIVQGEETEAFRHLVDVVTSAPMHTVQRAQSMTVDISQRSSQYTTAVEKALSKIEDGQVMKTIVSRAVSLPERVDMLATLLVGRELNTPKRSFSFNHAGYQSTGFSPELIVSLEQGKIITEPLAGTRAFPDDLAERARLRNELENDPKEIVEHIMSVKEAITELQRICPHESVVVEDLMSVRIRGKVQHLGSRVTGALGDGRDCWDALNVLFPSITASGIPKTDALEAIESLESGPRELYSGGVIMMEPSEGTFEASLVLRSVFQDRHRQWAQAGAGIISQSQPERELTETCEKLSTITPFLVREEEKMAFREQGSQVS